MKSIKKINFWGVCVSVLMLTYGLSAYAQPANDNPCQATPLTPGSACTWTSATNVNATNTPTTGIPAPGCASYSGQDVWFSVVVPAGGVLNIDSNTGSMTDGGMAAYSGSCTSMTLLGCNDDSSPNGLMPYLSLTGLTPGNTIWIRFWDYGGGTGTFSICVVAPPPPQPPPSCVGNPPAGDDCASATPICDLNGYCGSTAASYSADYWSQLNTAFCGSIENNSFITFTASSSSISFNVWVTSSTLGYGIQIYIFSATNCSGAVTGYTCWNPGTAQVGPTTVSATGLTPGNTYYIMIDGNSGDVCNYIIGANTGISTPAVVNPTASTICVGESVNLTASGGNGTYNWTGSAGLNTTTGANVVATPASAGTYTYTVNSSTGNPLCPSSTSSTATITVNNCGCTVTAGNNGPVCSGGTVNLTATTISGATYSWSGPSGYSSTSQNPTNVAVPATPGTYNYTVTATVSGVPCTSTTTVTVNPLATVNANADQTICAGTTATLAGSFGGGASSATWTAPSGSFSSATNMSAVYTPTITSGTVTLTLTTNDPAGPCAAVTDQMVLTVNPLPTVTVNNSTICAGASATITATPGVADSYDYVWTVPGGVTNPGNVPSFTTTVAGTYSVIITNTSTNCSSASASGTVTVNALPSVNAGNDVAVCAGVSTTLAATGASTYSWAPGGQTTASISVTPATTTSYTVSGTDANGCINTDQVIVTVNPIPVVSAGSDISICTGGSTTLTATGANTYSWSPGGQTTASITVSPASNTTYTVTGTSLGCTASDAVTVTVSGNAPINAGADVTICAGASTTLTGTGGNTYLWAPGGQTTAAITVTPATTTTYTLSGTDGNGCSGSDQVVVTVNPLPTVNAGADQVVCAGTSVTLSASGASSYSWDNGVTQDVAFTPSATTTYTVIGTTAEGCTSTDQVIVTVNPLPAVSAGSDFAVCTGGSVTLSGTGASAYSWDNGVTQDVAFTPSATTTYTVTGTTAAGCTGTDQITVSVLTNAPINAGTDVSICNGQSTTLTATGGITYNWDNGLGTGNSFTVSPTGTTSYTVTGTDGNGCTGTDAITVTVNPLPTVNAGADQTVCFGTSVTLTGAGASTYTWDNGVTQGVAFTPAVGSVVYTVTGTTATGCTGTDQVTVTVTPMPTTNAGTDQTICAGTSVTLTATGATTYSWDNGVNQGVVFSPSSTTTYTVTGTTSGCTTTDQVTITVNPLPSVNAGADQTVCDGTSVTLTAIGATTYTWDNGVTNGVSFTPSVGSITYSVTGTTAEGCSATDQVIVTVNPNPVPVIQGPTEYCIGNTATLSTSVSYAGYSWSTGSTSSTVNVTAANNPISVTVSNAFGCQATSSTYTVTENSVITANFTETICQGQSVLIHGVSQSVAGTYSQTFTSASGCDSVSNVTLVVNPLPAVNAGPDQTVCTPTSVTLNASGASTYAWNNSITQGTPFNQPVGSTTYTVTGTDVNGCINTDQVVVTVNPLPAVNAGVDQTLCIGASATLSGSGASTYTWNNGVSNGVAFTPAATTTYTVTGTDANGCINTDQVVVTVNPLPNVNAGTDQTVCVGATVTLSGAGAVNYTWDNGVTNGVSFVPSSTTTYTVTGTDVNGCLNTDQVLVSVNPLPTVNAGLDVAVCVGQSVTLSGSGAATYSWSGGIQNGFAFTPAVTTTYTVTGTSAAGCTSTDQVTVTVNSLPNVSAGVDQAICIGASATLSGSGASTYTWNNGVTNGIAFAPIITTTYTVSGTDANGCVNTDQAMVTVNPLPNVNAGQDQTICIGTGVTLTATGGTTYTWDNGVNQGIPFTPSSTATYTVTGTSAAGCTNTDQVVVTVNPLPVVNAGPDQTVCLGTAVTLSGSGAAAYSWSGGITNGQAFTPAAGSVTYSVTGTDANGCINTDQAVVTVNPLPAVNAGIDVSVCEGEQVTLTASGAQNYSWTGGVSNGVTFTPSVGTTTYTVTGTDANGCVNTDAVNVTVNPLPNVFAGNNISVCEGQTVILTASGANTYSWTGGVTQGVGFIPVVGTSTYSVTGTSTAGCTNSDQLDVTVNLLPIVSFMPDITMGCVPQTVTLTNSTPNSQNCIWTVSNGTTVTGCGAVPVTFNQGGCYDVTLTTTNTDGCTSSFTANNLICVEDYPNASFNPSETQVSNLNTEVFFENTTTGANVYNWTFGFDDVASTEQNPLVVFPQDEGYYNVTLIAYSPFGCADTANTTIQVYEELIYYVPNTFTPDDDSFNPIFQPVFTSGFDPYDYSLFIFNRWGELIFESHDATVGWDGTYGSNGEIEMCQDGTYTWKIEFKVTRWDERKQAVGHVNLIR